MVPGDPMKEFDKKRTVPGIFLGHCGGPGCTGEVKVSEVNISIRPDLPIYAQVARCATCGRSPILPMKDRRAKDRDRRKP